MSIDVSAVISPRNRHRPTRSILISSKVSLTKPVSRSIRRSGVERVTYVARGKWGKKMTDQALLYLFAALATGTFSVVPVAIYAIKQAMNREKALRAKLGWVSVLPAEEREELENNYLMMKYQEKVFQEANK